MAIDIRLNNSGLPPKHGTVVCNPGGICTSGTFYNKYSPKDVKEKPVIADIDDKYDTRFDDPTYYG